MNLLLPMSVFKLQSAVGCNQLRWQKANWRGVSLSVAIEETMLILFLIFFFSVLGQCKNQCVPVKNSSVGKCQYVNTGIDCFPLKKCYYGLDGFGLMFANKALCENNCLGNLLSICCHLYSPLKTTKKCKKSYCHL